MSTRRKIKLPALFSLLALAALGGYTGGACSDDGGVGPGGNLVGGRCVTDVDCRKRCLHGGDFPGGYCSVSCRADADCPDGTVCIHKEDGVCLLKCELASDCPTGYRCEGKDREGVKDAQALVCVAD